MLYLSGTSMAGPHVAGVVALMRAANPDVDVDTIKQILMDTATDLGAIGEDNTYGHGLINAYDAVLAVLDGYGWIEGTVRDGFSGLPIPNAVVNVVGDPRTTATSADGSFSLALPAGAWTLEYAAFGYLTDSQRVPVSADMTVDGSFLMNSAPPTVVSGTVRDFEFALVEGATITVVGTPLTSVLSQADGTYAIAVPDGATYDIKARKDGLGGDTHTIDVSGPTTLDFLLPELNSEDFESGDFQLWPWEMSGTAPWIIDSANPYEGTYAAKSGDINDDQDSIMEMTLIITQPGNVTFWYSVSSEANYDYLRFYIDNVERNSWSGTVGWTQASYPVSAGTHTFKWSYTKDYSVSNGSDAGFVDLIDFPAIGAPTYPEISVSPSSMAATVLPDQQMDQTLTLDNTGDGALQYNVSVEEPASALITWLSLSPVSGIIGPVSSGSVTVTYDATGLEIGVYAATIRVNSNDPAQPVVEVPVTLTVDDVTPVTDLQKAFRFDGAAPNPFNPMTTLHFSLPEAGHAELKLFDVQGRLVRTLVDGQLRAGPGQVRWDGRDQGGRRVASGTYYARLVAAGQSSVKPLVLVK